MEKVKTLGMFAVRVFVALCIINLVIGLLPVGIGDKVRSFSIDPLGTLRG